jgi:D-alanyl-D-alanine carboxypeptidase (penicillin-binding protein 5/6)
MHLPARFSAFALAGTLLLAPVTAAPAAQAPTGRPTGHAAATVPATRAAPARLAAAAHPAAATSAALARAPRGVQAEGGALVDAASAAVMWSRGMNTERPMGSITKVMTAIVVLRAGDLHRRIKVPKGVIPYDRKYGASQAGLRPGDYLTTRELLEALLLPSGCDAAYALAKSFGPGWTAFIATMNSTAQAMGLAHTHFSNFDGLPWPTETSTYSTPRDLIALGEAAMRYPVFRSIVDQPAAARLPGYVRDQDRVHQRGRVLPAVRGARERPGPDRCGTAQLAHQRHRGLHRCHEDTGLGLPTRLACKAACRPLDSIRWRAAPVSARHLTLSGGRNTWGS